MNDFSAKAKREAQLDRREHVPADVSDARLARVARRLEARLDAPKRANKLASAAIAGGMVAAAAAAVALLQPWHEPKTEAPQAWTKGTIRVGQAPAALTLADGSTIHAKPSAVLSVVRSAPEHVEVALSSGEATFDVQSIQDRKFVVRADQVRVRGDDAQFSMNHQTDPSVTSVDVHRGTLRAITFDGMVRTLSAGESWALRAPVAQVVRDLPEPKVNEQQERSPPADAVEPKADTQPSKAERRRASATKRARRARGSASRARAASTLLEAGAAARREGRTADAAEAYEALLRRYPSDARTALAAFELGRLRMDVLGDPKGAARVLQKVAHSSRGRAFHEDAVARLVELYHRSGQSRACSHAKETYLSAYPKGRSAKVVAARCE